jgi:3',5'-cyclic-nucleotide phosphodiesterase/cAMP-specific phosphodiesterase 4
MLFKRFRVASTLKVYKPDMIGDFILTINMQYQNNLYHNSMHAIDVTNSTAFFLENGLDK